MSGPEVAAREAPRNPAGPDLLGWLDRGIRRLYPYRPPFRDRRFWVVQGLVVLVAAVHTYAEAFEVLGRAGDFQPLYFVPSALFFIPVVYAALNFGLAGAVATALWSTFLTAPNWVVYHGGWDRAGCMFQVGVVDAIAVFVGQRVEREMSARQRAEAAGAALTASETKYRGLFESSPVAVLVLDSGGIVREANPAAGVLFGRGRATLKGISVADLVGGACVESLLQAPGERGHDGAPLTLKQRGSRSDVYLEPALTRASDDQGDPVLQVVLRDVTAEHLRQAGLRAYAAHVIRGQEEERKRIAQELHDETVQALILLCRRLDTVESTNGALPRSAVEGLREARRSAEEMLQQLRDFAKALRPPTLDDLGLVTSIRRLLLDITERAKLEGHLRVLGHERRLPPDIELGVFRIAQEALRNVERHARATHAAVTLSFTDDRVRLEVLDNGAGFAVPAGLGGFAASGKLGLLGMQERAELLGGRLEVHSDPAEGTRVTAYVPAGNQPQ